MEVFDLIELDELAASPLNHEERTVGSHEEDVLLAHSLHCGNAHGSLDIRFEIESSDCVEVLVEAESVNSSNSVLHVVLSASTAEEDIWVG